MALTDLQKGGLAVGGGLDLAGLGMLFGGGDESPNYFNPAGGAFPFLDQIQSSMPSFYDQYRSGGHDSYDKLSGQADQMSGLYPGISNQLQGMSGQLAPFQETLSRMMRDPSGILSQLGKGYQKSPGYDFELNQALTAANNSATAGGMAGTPLAQQNAAQIAQQMASKDYNQYLNHALDLFGGGTSGLGQLGYKGLEGQMGLFDKGLGIQSDLSKMGYDANSRLSQMIAEALMNKGNLAYAGQANMNNMNQADFQRQQQQTGAEANTLGQIGGAAMMLPFLIP